MVPGLAENIPCSFTLVETKEEGQKIRIGLMSSKVEENLPAIRTVDHHEWGLF
jgi:hypothetical protein